MARQPKLVLRESAIEDVTQKWSPGSFLETGAGTGYMTKKFLQRGFYGACFDRSSTASEKIRNNLSACYGKITVLKELDELGDAEFDYLLSFEVLEHIEDDVSALKEWTRFLKPGGKLLLSVPAHQNKFGKADLIVGHLRRYERTSLKVLLEKAGYENIRFYNYGFPISEFTRIVSNLLIKRKSIDQGLSLQQRSLQSSYERPQIFRNLINLLGEKWVLPFAVTQRWFYKYDFGDGIIATASKTY